MKCQFASSLIAASIFGAAADEHKQTFAEVFASTHQKIDVEPKTQAAPIEKKPSKKQNKRRLLMKQRKQRALKAHLLNQQSPSNHAERTDVGVLFQDRNSRFLAEDDDSYEYYCPRDTCPTELCDCADNGGDLSDCSNELKSVCAAGRLGDCVFEDYVQVYSEVYCPFVSCIGEGYQENQCDCAFYEMYCTKLESDECKTFMESDDPDKTRVFGCDPDEMAGVCEEATACKSRGELDGLPDLSKWQGSNTVGINAQNGAGRQRGNGAESVVAGVTVLSVLWYFANISWE